MMRRRAGASARFSWREILPPTLTVAACAAGTIASPTDRVNSLSVVLGLGAAVAGYLVVGERGGIGVSPSFIVWVLAAAFLGTDSPRRWPR